MDRKTLAILGILFIIINFTFHWTMIPKNIKHAKQSGKTILNENNFVKSLKKETIIHNIILGLIVILAILNILVSYKLNLTIAVYFLIEAIVYYKIHKKYIIENPNKRAN